MQSVSDRFPMIFLSGFDKFSIIMEIKLMLFFYLQNIENLSFRLSVSLRGYTERDLDKEICCVYLTSQVFFRAKVMKVQV